MDQPRGRRLKVVASHLVGSDGRKRGTKKTRKGPQAEVVPPDELLAQIQGEWQDQHGTVIEIVDNTWPALQRAESIFGSRTDTPFRGAPADMKNPKSTTLVKPKRSPT